MGLKLPLDMSPHSQGPGSRCVNHRDNNPKCGVVVSVAGGSASNSALKPIVEVQLR